MWKYLIKECTPQRIREFPDYKKGEKINGKKPKGKPFSNTEKLFLSLFLFYGNGGTRKSISGCFFKPFNTSTKRRIIENLGKIKKWRILKYTEYYRIMNRKATWFIDPPYQRAGKLYTNGSKDIDYKKLSSWCIDRKGQVIVCEENCAKWLPFRPVKGKGAVGNTKSKNGEAVWIRG